MNTFRFGKHEYLCLRLMNLNSTSVLEILQIQTIGICTIIMNQSIYRPKFKIIMNQDKGQTKDTKNKAKKIINGKRVFHVLNTKFKSYLYNVL